MVANNAGTYVLPQHDTYYMINKQLFKLSFILRFTLYLLVFLFVLNVPVNAQSTVSDSSFFLMPEDEYSHFLFRMNVDGEPQRVFALGAYISLLHPKYFQEFDPRHNRIPNEALFNTLREHYTLIYTPFTYVNEVVKRPAFYDSLQGDSGFVMGAGHIPWWLRTNYGVERKDLLSRKDQESLASRIDQDHVKEPIQNLIRFTGDSNLIINLADEPERGGYGGSWFYSKETLKTMYELASEHGLVSIGLGPVGNARGRGVGNKLTWSLEFPFSWFQNPSDRRIRRTKMTWRQILDSMLRYYDGVYDIIYLNSYAFTISDNRRAGKIVKQMLHHPTIDHKKPVWLWISVENFRHPDPEKGYQQIRRQAFSAIANEGSGLMFYPDVNEYETGDYDETLWFLSLELMKELQYWRPVLEKGKMIKNYVDRDVEWIQYNYDGQEVVFLVNHGSKALSNIGHGLLYAAPGQSGVWYRNKGETTFNHFKIKP